MKTQRHLISNLSIIAMLLYTFLLPSSVYSASLHDVVISEIAWMGTTTSYNDEWIELYNNTGSSISLTGWSLSAEDGTPAITLSGSIPAGGYYLLERTDDNSVPGVAYDKVYTGELNNDGENLALRDQLSTVIDQVDCGSGWFSGHNDAKIPMVRVDTTADGSQASNWTFNPRCGDATNSLGDSHDCTPPEYLIPKSLDYSVYFDERATTASATTLEHTEMENALLSQINNAATSIDVALYDLNRQSVIDALVAAYDSGVEVRVVGDDEAATSSGYSSFYQQLTTAGITVTLDTSLPKIQHNKFMVFDSHIVWTGSANFTDTGLSLNADSGIVITDTTLAEIYTVEFEEMWSGKFHTDKEDNTKHLLKYDNGLVKSFFSPTDLVAFDVWNELAHADESIHFAMFMWTDEILGDRAVERLNAGVQVWGVWDQLGVANQYSQYQKLCAAGAIIGIEDLPGKVHHKFAVIDVNGSDPTVIMGSYNWTDSGAYDNDENTLIFHNQALAQAYYAEWQRLWRTIEVDRICNPFQTYLPILIK